MKVEMVGFDFGSGIQFKLIPENKAEEIIVASISDSRAVIDMQEDDSSVLFTCGVSNG